MNRNLIPGLVDDNVEMFVQNDDLKVIHQGKVISFDELPVSIKELIKEEMYVEKNVLRALNIMHPNSIEKMVEQFAKCRLGGLDFQADIKNGQIQDGEYWPCPKHGSCEHEGVLCKLPKFNKTRLTKQDIQLMQLSTTEKTNEVIAEEMNLPLGSFHKAKKYIHEVLGVQTKQGITLICAHLNLFS